MSEEPFKTTAADWEKRTSFYFRTEPTSKDQLTYEEFMELVNKEDAVNIDYDQRVAFLKENGHKVNRKNLTDRELGAINPEEVSNDETTE